MFCSKSASRSMKNVNTPLFKRSISLIEKNEIQQSVIFNYKKECRNSEKLQDGGMNIAPADVGLAQIEKSLSALDIASQKANKKSLISNLNFYLNSSNPQNSYKNFKNMTDLPENFGLNQVLKSSTEKERELKHILWKFHAPIRFSFGYGSGVIEQKGYGTSNKASESKPQIDLIFGVTFPDHWHHINVEQHPSHYSSLKLVGSNMLQKIQNSGAGLYFNPYIEIEKNLIKYGVISMEKLMKDLEDWDNLYVAGRLHKPVKVIRDDPRIRFINQHNLKSVVSLSMLLLSDRPSFNEFDLYETITNISYLGDPRMYIGGENPQKITNIVDKQYLNFRHLYNPLLNLFINNLQTINSSSNEIYQFKQNLSPDSKATLIQSLPISFRRRLYNYYSSKFSNELSRDEIAKRVLQYNSTNQSTLSINSIGEYPLAIAKDANLHNALVKTIQSTVVVPASIQTFKGIFTAGLNRSFKYAWEKNTKYWQSK